MFPKNEYQELINFLLEKGEILDENYNFIRIGRCNAGGETHFTIWIGSDSFKLNWYSRPNPQAIPKEFIGIHELSWTHKKNTLLEEIVKKMGDDLESYFSNL
ncbi:MAG: hypothetical protein HN677_01065 [Flavobacteriales bacterium]|nr:hypothetical protein [Flavobacteriales bacterium]